MSILGLGDGKGQETAQKDEKSSEVQEKPLEIEEKTYENQSGIDLDSDSEYSSKSSDCFEAENLGEGQLSIGYSSGKREFEKTDSKGDGKNPEPPSKKRKTFKFHVLEN